MNTVLNETEYAVFTLCNPKDPVSGLVLASPCRLPRRLTWVDPDWGGGGRGFRPPGKSQVAIGFLKNTSTDQPREEVQLAWVPV